jgi:hypothetical protein
MVIRWFWLQCFHDALIRAVRDLGNARVIALYNREHHAGIAPR